MITVEHDNKTTTSPKRHLRPIEGGERYRLLVENIQDYAIFLLDPEGRVTTWNRGAERLKGYKPAEIIGKHFSVFYLPNDIAAGKPEHELEDVRRLGRIEDEGWRVRKDGTRFWANVIITALYDDQGKLTGYAKVTRDLTERKHNEDMLQAANRSLEGQREQLERLNNLKDEFISLASHQLRTPATGVKQYLGLLLQGYAGELGKQQRYYLEKAYVSNDRQIELVNDLLRVAQLDGGRVTLKHTLTDIGALVQDVIWDYAATVTARHQHLDLRPLKRPVKATVDPKHFRMVVENLVDNASKYTPGGGKITASVSRENGALHVSVADNGVGIEQEQIPRLFQKFSRIPNELSDSVGGSGLGLYWVAKVVGLHGGTVHVRSKQGQGTTFEVIIPKEAAVHA